MRKGWIVPLGEKLAYGVGDTAISLAFGAVGFYLLWFIVNVGGVSPGLAGVIFLVAKAWDAITDYWMGRISDRTRTRWGRRRPYLLFGAVPFGVLFAALWLVPGGSETARFIYYLVVIMLFNTAFTVVAVPYGALVAELTQNYDERTSLTGYRMASAFLGVLLGAAGITLIVDVIYSEMDKAYGYSYAGILFGLLIIGILLVTFSGTRERTKLGEQRQEGFFATIFSFFKMKEFRCVLLMFLLNMVGIDIIMAILYFYLLDVIKITTDDVTVFMAIPLVVALMAAPLWVYLGQRWSKPKAYFIAVCYFSTSMLLCLVIPTGNLVMTVIITVLAGIGISAAQILPWSILPDVVEIDEYNNGIRREGAYFGIVVFMYKVASAIAIAGTAFVLELFGYIEASPDEAIAATQVIEQPESALLALRILLGVVPGVCFVVSALFAKAMPITRERFESILKELEARRLTQREPV